MMKKRNFLKSIAITTGATVFTPRNLYSTSVIVPKVEIACQQYTWFSYYNRENKSWMENPDESFKAYLKSGFKGYEPSFSTSAEVVKLKAILDTYKIRSKSMYVNSVLHEPQLV